MFTTIKSFEDININNISKTLILCDIDDTILHFPEINKIWWHDKTNYYYNQHESNELEKKQALNDWITYITIKNPMITDSSLYNFISNYNIVFITARNSYLKDLTQKHFNHLDIKFDNNIYYTSGENKGIYIKNNLLHLIKKYTNIIFIDDLEHNLIDVYDQLNSLTNIKCFQIKFN